MQMHGALSVTVALGLTLLALICVGAVSLLFDGGHRVIVVAVLCLVIAFVMTHWLDKNGY
jgi:multisubunit Na+/H+ antiporter MnhG subunit